MPKKLALLIGSRQFEDRSLGPLAAPWTDVEELGNVLEETGGFEVDKQADLDLTDARAAIQRHFDKAQKDDTVLFYYTGHGLRDARAPGLHLALRRTKTDVVRATALEAAFIREQMQLSRSQRQIVIYDCCHSGEAARGSDTRKKGTQTLVEDDVLAPGGTGQYVLTASAADESAFERDGRSIYTEFMVEALRTGAAAPEKEEITVDDLHDYLVRRVGADEAPMQPHIWKSGATGPLVIARNPDPRRPIPPQLIEGLFDPDILRAQGAVAGLLELMNGSDARLQDDAKAELEKRLSKNEDLFAPVADSIRRGLGIPNSQEELDRVLQAERAELEAAAEALRAQIEELEAKLKAQEADLETSLHADREISGKAIETLKAEREALEVSIDLKSKELEAAQAEHVEELAQKDAALAAATDRRDEAERRVACLQEALRKTRSENASNDGSASNEPKIGELVDQVIAEGERKLAAATGSVKADAVWWKKQPWLAAIAVLCLITAAALYFAKPPLFLQEDWDVPLLETFSECAGCPDMVRLPGGTYVMGSPESEEGRDEDEGPQIEVTIDGFAMARTEVTYAQWRACIEGGGCADGPQPTDETWGGEEEPVTHVSWQQAHGYVAWLNNQVSDGSPYRLPTEAEWEYAARASVDDVRGPIVFADDIRTVRISQTRYPWGNEWDRQRAHSETSTVAEVGRYPANGFGLFDMHGNVWEWTGSRYRARLGDAASETAGYDDVDTDMTIRGGSYMAARSLRSANRASLPPLGPFFFGNEGFRPVRDLE